MVVDRTQKDKQKGEKRLRPKYEVQKIGGPVQGETCRYVDGLMLSTDPDNIDSPFVLMPRRDPAAFAAMLTYMGCCENGLRIEIRDWLIKIAEAEPVYGTQGKRNRAVMRIGLILKRLEEQKVKS